jgi:hypothetical protein
MKESRHACGAMIIYLLRVVRPQESPRAEVVIREDQNLNTLELSYLMRKLSSSDLLIELQLTRSTK